MKLFRSGLIAVVAILCLCGLVSTSHAQNLSSLYMAGASYNAGANTPVAGTLLYAHQVSPDTAPGMYAFSAVDVLPVSVKPFTVTTNIGAGIAQKVATISNIPIFIPTSAGISFTGQNTGWAWGTGAGALFQVKKSNWYVMPTVRVLKSSVSSGSGYQPIVGVLFGWGQ